jgi:hypothetical protein
MVFDLRRALLAKEERESARLMDFEFRLRARTLRLLAARIGRNPDDVIGLVTEGDDDVIVGKLRSELPNQDIDACFAEARAEARRLLMMEVGDPAPHRLG